MKIAAVVRTANRPQSPLTELINVVHPFASSHAKLPIEDKAYQRAALCVTAKIGPPMVLWVNHDRGGRGVASMHVRFAPKATVR
jgi:hypothetical protein